MLMNLNHCPYFVNDVNTFYGKYKIVDAGKSLLLEKMEQCYDLDIVHVYFSVIFLPDHLYIGVCINGYLNKFMRTRLVIHCKLVFGLLLIDATA